MVVRIKELVHEVDVAFKARRLFRNWFGSFISYVIGDDYVRVVCRDGSGAYLERVVFGRLVRAYYEGLIKDYLCGEGVVVNKYGDKIPIMEIKRLILDDLRSGWRYVDGFWVWNSIRLRHFYHSVYEVFNSGDYGELNVDGKYVIDIGAFIGDSTIYFLMRGSRFVIAVEPYPQAFEELLVNVRVNGLLGRVLPINAAISYDGEYVCISSGIPMSSVASTYFGKSVGYDCDFVVKAMSLSKLLSLINVADPSRLALKLDCEGCELDIVTRDYDALLSFGELMIEWHSRKLGVPIDRALSMLKDFDCTIIKNRLLHCVRRS